MTALLRRDTAREKRREQGHGFSAEVIAEFLRPLSYPNAVGMGAAVVGVFIVGRRVEKKKKRRQKARGTMQIIPKTTLSVKQRSLCPIQ